MALPYGENRFIGPMHWLRSHAGRKIANHPRFGYDDPKNTARLDRPRRAQGTPSWVSDMPWAHELQRPSLKRFRFITPGKTRHTSGRVGRMTKDKKPSNSAITAQHTSKH